LHPATGHRHRLHQRPTLATLLLASSLALLAGGCKKKGSEAFNKGQAHLQKKRYADAITSFQKAATQNPSFGEAYYNLGAARYQLAAMQLNGLVDRQGSPALKAALQATRVEPGAAGKLTPEGPASLTVLRQELSQLPAAQAEPIVTLLRQSLAAKLKAQALFRKGKFVVIRKSTTRRSLLAKLDSVARLHKLLRKSGEQDRGLWLVAVARPVLLTESPAAPSRPRHAGAKKP